MSEVNDLNQSVAAQFLAAASNRIASAAVERDAPGGERSMARAVAIFKAWTGIDIPESDGWRFMLSLKLAREVQGECCPDDYVDIAGYAALLGECCKGGE